LICIQPPDVPNNPDLNDCNSVVGRLLLLKFLPRQVLSGEQALLQRKSTAEPQQVPYSSICSPYRIVKLLTSLLLLLLLLLSQGSTPDPVVPACNNIICRNSVMQADFRPSDL
jgi:hypothetical protein